MKNISDIITHLSTRAKTELLVFAQGQPELINSLIDEVLEDAQTELDILYELGFLDLDSDEDDEEYARAEFSADIRLFIIEDLGNTHKDVLIAQAIKHRNEYVDFPRDAPTAARELGVILHPSYETSQPDGIEP